jgi:hypothetical protein|tara:strand:+ start:2127 stop:2327 length:201 start_codon:yes stop_codon:yes gene_type:complete
MGIKVEGHTHLYREETSHAIINTDVEQYRLHKVRKQRFLAQKEEINTLKSDVSEMKLMLQQLLDRT